VSLEGLGGCSVGARVLHVGVLRQGFGLSGLGSATRLHLVHHVDHESDQCGGEEEDDHSSDEAHDVCDPRLVEHALAHDRLAICGGDRRAIDVGKRLAELVVGPDDADHDERDHAQAGTDQDREDGGFHPRFDALESAVGCLELLVVLDERRVVLGQLRVLRVVDQLDLEESRRVAGGEAGDSGAKGLEFGKSLLLEVEVRDLVSVGILRVGESLAGSLDALRQRLGVHEVLCGPGVVTGTILGRSLDGCEFSDEFVEGLVFRCGHDRQHLRGLVLRGRLLGRGRSAGVGLSGGGLRCGLGGGCGGHCFSIL